MDAQPYKAIGTSMGLVPISYSNYWVFAGWLVAVGDGVISASGVM